MCRSDVDSDVREDASDQIVHEEALDRARAADGSLDDRLVGRTDMQMDRKRNHLVINALYAEEDAPSDAAAGIFESIDSLAAFLGADEIEMPGSVPPVWRNGSVQ